MSQDRKELSEAKMLAAMLIGSMDMSMNAASVQRSHRFPLHIFTQMENMAKIANVSVSVIINQMLEAGLEAVMIELPKEIQQQVTHVSEAQLNRPLKQVNGQVKRRTKSVSNKS
jgi:hypothetical protein